ncbi:unnamed protein product [Pleuronectes platessa]|uniref:Glycine receptor subunit beta n=1 Tax=Pleuronectes platessa TaxID=8262 RepID=A0A9N7Z1F0_PLEPL|nr:unnamed protein product [Pleuronectes platessa]
MRSSQMATFPVPSSPPGRLTKDRERRRGTKVGKKQKRQPATSSPNSSLCGVSGPREPLSSFTPPWAKLRHMSSTKVWELARVPDRQRRASRNCSCCRSRASWTLNLGCVETRDYRVNIFLRQRWNDPRLKLPQDFKSDSLTVDPKMFKCLWKPDLFFANEKSANFHDVTQENILLFIFRNGDVLIIGYTTDDLQFFWQTGDPVQMDAIALPQFDIRQETLITETAPNSMQEQSSPWLNITLAHPLYRPDGPNMQPHRAKTSTAVGGYYTCVEVIFTLRRQVGFYMMGVYAPTLLIVVLSWLSFWINPDASAARLFVTTFIPSSLQLHLEASSDFSLNGISAGILSVLSLSSECTSLAQELPKVSYVKAIDVWLIACLLFGFASLVEYAVVQVMLNSPKRIEAEKAKMASKEKAEGKSPAAKNNTVNGTGGTPLHVSTLHVAETRCKKVCTSKSDLRTNDFSIVGSLPRDFELSNFDCYGKPIDLHSARGKALAKHHKKAPPPKPVIPSAAKRVDLYSRALFPFSFLFFNVIYWSVYL